MRRITSNNIGFLLSLTILSFRSINAFPLISKHHHHHHHNSHSIRLIRSSSSTSFLPRNTCLNSSFQNDNNESKQNNLEEQYDEALSNRRIRTAVRLLGGNPNEIRMTKERLVNTLNAVEMRTAEPEENDLRKLYAENPEAVGSFVPPISGARVEMTEMYEVLAKQGYLKMFGSAGKFETINGDAIHPYPAAGSNIVTPPLLEQITGLPMENLTPKGSGKLFLFGGLLLCVAEGFASFATGIDFDYFVFATLLFAVMDKVIVNGAVGETIFKVFFPQYAKKVLRHEAGHFLCAYLLGLPVEGCVLSAWASLEDARFKGQVTAGTSFFDPVLSDDINKRRTVTRPSIDRYSIVVMAGIAAEAINFDMAEGGGGDEISLAAFLSNINPDKGSSSAWTLDRIKNQARWGACQSILLLRQYQACYEALVDALERGGKLGECVYAIEKAARDNNLEPLNKPIGVIRDVEPFGAWELLKENENTPTSSTVTTLNPSTVVASNASLQSSSIANANVSNPPTESGEGDAEVVVMERLQSSKQRMLERLQQINNELSELE